MKKLTFIALVTLFSNVITAQISQTIKSKIDNELKNKLSYKYKGNISLNDYKKFDENSFVVIGNFDWEVDAVISRRIEKRKFKAIVKVIFDEIEIAALSWEKVTYLGEEYRECITIIENNSKYKNIYMCYFNEL